MSDFKAFCEDVFNESPQPWQEAVANSGQWAKFCNCGRGSGKSWLLRKLLLWHAIRNENSTCIAVASSKSQLLKILNERLRYELRHSKLKSSLRSDLKDELVLSNGSRIFMLSSEASSSRGFQPMQYQKDGKLMFGGFCVAFEEAAHLAEFKELYSAMYFGLLSVEPSKRLLLVATTPSSMNHPSFELYSKGLEKNDDYISFNVPSYENKNWKGDVEKLKEELSPLEYETEIEAKWCKAINSYFGDVLDECIGSYELEKPEPEAVYVVGCDLALGLSGRCDNSVISVVAKKDGVVRVVEAKVWKKVSQHQLEDYLNYVNKKYKPIRNFIESFQGKALAEFSEKKNYPTSLFHPTSGYQQESFSRWHALMARKQFIVDKRLQLALEMSSFEQRISNTGHVSYGSVRGSHDDTIYSVLPCIDALYGYEGKLQFVATYDREFTDKGIGYEDGSNRTAHYSFRQQMRDMKRDQEYF